MTNRDMDKAALRGEPSYVWREGQRRRLEMIAHAAQERVRGRVLENGCGVGMYVERLAGLNSALPKEHRDDVSGQSKGARVIGLEYDFERAAQARVKSKNIVNAAGEWLPFPESTFDLILSHEVIEHVADDGLAVREMVRALKPAGRIVLFCPHRGYPFETHGIFWRGRYYFGNKPFVNYLPRRWRDQLAPHVRVYSKRDLEKLFADLPVKFVERRIIFGAYDNIIARFGVFGKFLRAILQFMEKTPLQWFGLSHFWVVEKV